MLQNRFQKILVPLDGSPTSVRGLNEAISLARQSNGTIIGMYVIPRFPPKIAKILKSYRIQLEKTSEKIMAHAKTSAARHGVSFDRKVIVSQDIVKTVTGYAKTTKSDIIILGSRGEGGSDKEYLGSVANGIIHESKIPVLVVK